MSTEETWFPKGPKGGTKFTFDQLSHSTWKVIKINEHDVQKEDISSDRPSYACAKYICREPNGPKEGGASSASINKFHL